MQPTLKEWNQSSNAWERRASIVSMIYYASTKRIAPTFRTVISLIEPLIGDQDRYVQKAIGWQLRELHKLYPAQTLSLLYNTPELSPTSFSYATERLTQKERTDKEKDTTISRHDRVNLIFASHGQAELVYAGDLKFLAEGLVGSNPPCPP